MSRSVTLDDVARLANVSPITASRALRNHPLVTQTTKEKVLKASRQCGYLPSAAARSMRSGRQHRIAAVVVRFGKTRSSYWPIMNGYLDPAVDVLAEQGYSLVMEPLMLDVHTKDFIQPPKLFGELSVDGALGIVAGMVTPQIDKQVKELGVPVVWCNRKDAGSGYAIGCDEVASGRMLAEYLIARGHRQIGYIGCEGTHYSASDRYLGVEAVLKEHGLSRRWLVQDNQETAALDVADHLFRLDQKPSAVICYSMQYYQAALHQAAYMGLRVPKDMSLCYVASAWENDPSWSNATHIRLPEVQIGQQAASELLKLLNSKSGKAKRPKATLVQPELIEGKTVKVLI
jgi:DNA-binding LacI/PurR family transcriptional regulator